MHSDRGRHWHVFVHFNGRIRSRNPRFFDIEGNHPHIRAANLAREHLERIWKYLNKEDWEKMGNWTGPVSKRYAPFFHIFLLIADVPLGKNHPFKRAIQKPSKLTTDKNFLTGSKRQTLRIMCCNMNTWSILLTSIMPLKNYPTLHLIQIL